MSNDDWPDDSRDRGFDGPEERSESQDSWYDGSMDSGAAPKKKGMSTATKILIAFLCGGALLFLVCCGGLIYLGTQLQFDQSNDPAVAEQRLEDMVEIEVPGSFEPRFSGSLGFFDFVSGTLVVFEAAEGEGALIFIHVNLEIEAGPEAEEEMRRSLRQQGNERQLRVESSETREFEIQGETCEFEFAQAKNEDGDAFRQVMGGFPTKEGTGLMVLQVDEERYDEEAVVKMIESIR